MENRNRSISDVVGEALGLDPNVAYRPMMIPAVKMNDGSVKPGVPSAFVELMKAFMLPGHVVQGGSYTPEDVTDMAMNVGMMGAPVGYATAPKGAIGMGGSRLNNAGLAMDEASRMARAKDMGFHTDLFHGTASDISAFEPRRRGLYMTDRPDIADIYAQSAGNSTVKNIRSEVSNAGPNIMPLKLRGEVLEVSDLGPDMSHGWSSDNLAAALNVKLDDFPVGTRARDMDNLAKQKGYTAIKIKDMLDLGGEQSQWRVLDPSAVRSKFAVFDPTQKNSTNLLSMNPATSAIPALFNQYQQKQR